MSFKMIANRHVYRSNEGKEYKKGESFTVESEAEMSRLVRYKRASVDETKGAPVKPVKRQTVEATQPPVQKVLTSEDQAAPAADPVTEATQLDMPKRYRRSDMRAED